MSKDAYDSPWKGILDRYFPDFIAFFFPQIYEEIDWSRGYEILDKELEQVTRDAELGKRFADKLIKVWSFRSSSSGTTMGGGTTWR